MTPEPFCGNGLIDPQEDCDHLNFNGASCESFNFLSGSLTCTTNCTIDTSNCQLPECGNGIIEGNEQCDTLDMNSETCESQGFDAGSLTCTENCTIDTNGCFNDPTCGNGTIEGDEECDLINLDNQTCLSKGYDGGTLTCTGDCVINTSGCLDDPDPVCGNGIIEGEEDCDNNSLAGATCTSLGYYGGELSCDSNCHYQLTDCYSNGYCGNQQIESPQEQCDGTNLNLESCQSRGYQTGTLACDSSCFYDESGCSECDYIYNEDTGYYGLQCIDQRYLIHHLEGGDSPCNEDYIEVFEDPTIQDIHTLHWFAVHGTISQYRSPRDENNDQVIIFCTPVCGTNFNYVRLTALNNSGYLGVEEFIDNPWQSCHDAAIQYAPEIDSFTFPGDCKEWWTHEKDGQTVECSVGY